MKKNVVFYFRYSSQLQDTGFSIEAQRRACSEFAERNNYNVVREYIDRAFSGTNDDRPEFMELVSDSKKGQFELCIVHKMDRFSRDLYQTLYYTNKLKDNNVDVVSVSENYDTATPEGMLLRNMMSSISEYFSKNLGKEVAKGMRENGFNARFNGGTGIYAYSICPDTKKYIINESEAPAVRKIFELFNKSYMYRDIIAELDRLDYKARNGKSFTPSAIRNILKDIRYIGTYTWGVTTRKRNVKKKQDESKVIRIEGGIDSIISKEEFEKAQIKINSRRIGELPRRSTSSLLSGLVRCSCGGKAYINTRKTKLKDGTIRYVRVYRCQNQNDNCKIPEIREDYLRNYLISDLFKVLENEINTENIIKQLNSKIQEGSKESKSNKSSLKSRVASLEKEISSLVKILAKGVAEDEIIKEIQIRQEEKREIAQKLSELEEPNEIPLVDNEEFKEFLVKAKEFILKNNIDSPELKEVIKMLVKSITISKEEVVIIYNFLLFWRINIPNLYIIVTINRNIFYNRKRKKKKFT